MDHATKSTKQVTEQTVNTNDLKKIVPTLQKEPVDVKAGLALLEHINNVSGFRITIHSQTVAGNIPQSPNDRLGLSSSSLFFTHPSKL